MSSHAGNHQLRLPSKCMIEGTSTIRTNAASMKMAVASPIPNSLMTLASTMMKLKNTEVMMAPAARITRMVIACPRATASPLSPVRWYSSCIRVTKNTS